MCGIVGYTGGRRADGVLLDGLATLEYRGYDSAGISVAGDNGIDTVKAVGRLERLREQVSPQNAQLTGCCGIGHTRWATHGQPSQRNAHPHATPRLSLVHNGIIENYQALKEPLLAQGQLFLSETDTEVAAWLLDSLYRGDPIAALRQLCAMLEGSYALGVLFADHPGELYAVRKGSPLVVARAAGESFLASDVTAVLAFTNQYYPLAEGVFARLTAHGIELLVADGTVTQPAYSTAVWSGSQAQRDGYPHFMLKEMHQQPQVLLDTIRPRLAAGLPSFAGVDGIPDSFWQQLGSLSLVACGTAYHAALVGKAAIEQLCRLPVEVEVASEFRYRDPILPRDRLVVVISQSGETADTLAALRLAQERGNSTLAIVNVAGSTIDREADYTIHTFAGPEIAVASTKAYSVQLGVLYLLAIRMGLAQHRLVVAEARSLCRQLLAAVEATREVLAQEEEIARLALPYRQAEHLFFLGRGLDSPVAMEGSLKLKEISYIHCEAYAAGEMKHGTISLIQPGTPVVAVATQQALLPKLISNLREVQSRGADSLLLCRENANPGEHPGQRILHLPGNVADLFMPLPTAVALQLLAYHTAVERGCDVDKPRNLAKSVTVE